MLWGMANQDLMTDYAQRLASEDSGMSAEYVKEFWDVWPTRADCEERSRAGWKQIMEMTPEEHAWLIGDMPV